MSIIWRLFRRVFAKPKTRYTYAIPATSEGSSTATSRSTTFVGKRNPVKPALNAALTGRCWVVDGDTIDIGGTRIRLAGIDAPELDHPFGKNAKWFLVRLCQGHEVKAVFHADLTHDRTVATCFLPDGRDLSAEMVKAGMAVDWPKFSGGKYRDLEVPGIRKKLWRCDARQKGTMPRTMPD